LYWYFYQFVPGFDGLRVPARFAMIVALGLAVLAGVGAAVLERARFGRLLIALSLGFMIAESWAVPIPLNVNSTRYRQPDLAPLPNTLPMGSDAPPVYRFIANLPPSSALLELPFGEIAFETRYMFFSISHWRPLANGYSGGSPIE